MVADRFLEAHGGDSDSARAEQDQTGCAENRALMHMGHIGRLDTPVNEAGVLCEG